MILSRTIKTSLLLFGVCLCVGVFTLLFLFGKNFEDHAISHIDTLQNSEYRTYFNTHIDEFYREEGISGMTQRVIDALRNGQISMFECHSLAHDIGHYAGYPDHFAAIEESLTKENLDFCGSGFLHGVEGQLANETYPENTLKLRAFCAQVQPLEPYYDGCYHGAGHAFMENTRDPSAALKECDSLVTDTLVPDVTHCYRGVFSEYSDYVYAAGKDEKELLAYCNSLDVRLQSYCAEELNGLHVSPEATAEDIEYLLQLCTEGAYSDVIKEGCVHSLASAVTDHTLSAARALVPVGYVYEMSPSLRKLYIAATFGTFQKTAAFHEGLSFADFCLEFKGEDQSYCEGLPQSE